MDIMLIQKHVVFILVFVFSLNNPQLSFSSSSSSNVTLPTKTSPLMLCHPLQSQALLQFISNFTIDTYFSYGCPSHTSYPKTESWKEGTDCCSWDGVTCDHVTGHVIGIDLSCSKLLGNIHSNNNTLFSAHIAPYLQRLNLSRNWFDGLEISAEFWVQFGSSLTHLNLSNSEFTGNILSEISLLSNLVSLDLSFNNLRVESDRVLENIAGNLTHLRVLYLDGLDMSSLHVSSLINLSYSLTSLSLSRCHFQGEFPVSFLVYPKLEELYLLGNNFNPVTSLPYLNFTSSNLLFLNLMDTTFSPSSSSTFLDFVGNNLRSLNKLYLQGCNISGPIPQSFGNLTKLNRLHLGYNHLSGPIPTSFSNLAHLTYWDMSDNEIEGPLPSYLFALPSLEIVNLSNNKLYGHITTSPINCMNLASLDLSNNSLSGSLDFDVFLSFNQLTSLDLSHNNISSSISASSHINFTYSLPSFWFLYLSNCNLSRFPTFFKALTNLTELHVSNSHIQGPIPDWLYHVGKDTLSVVDLSENSLTGVIGHLAGWKSIKEIYFSSNLLEGSLPIIPSIVAYFDVSNNHLSGVISSSICNLSSLQVFDLSYNQFTGSILQCLLNISGPSLLNLGMNELHGVIPNTFPTHRCYLSALVLRGNQLRGPIPSSLAHCVNLGLLDIGNNMIEDTVPHWLEKLSRLKVLILRSNKFFGSLNNFKPRYFFPALRILDLSNNRFDGQVPMMLLTSLIALTRLDRKLADDDQYMRSNSGEYYSIEITVKGSEMKYVKIWATLSFIDLSKNKFEGYIPREIGKFISLKGLNLSNNLLTRHIPSSMGNLTSLEWLDLSSNKLNGQIPNELKSMTFLSALNLSHNQLDGPIPQGKQFDTFTNDSYKGNLALCGLPLSKSCGPNHESPSENKGTLGSEGGFNWAFAFAGYGCGIVLGVSMGYIVFETGRPKWFVRMVDGKKQHGRVGQRPRRSSGRRRS